MRSTYAATATDDPYNDAKYANLNKVVRLRRGAYLFPNNIDNVLMQNKGDKFWVLSLPEDNNNSKNDVMLFVVRCKDFELQDHPSPLDLSMGYFGNDEEDIGHPYCADRDKLRLINYNRPDEIEKVRVTGISPKIIVLTRSYFDNSIEDTAPSPGCIKVVNGQYWEGTPNGAITYQEMQRLLDEYKYKHGGLGENEDGERTGADELAKNPDGTTAVRSTYPMMIKEKRTIRGKFDYIPDRYTVSDKKLASVNKKGILRAKGRAGTVTVTGYIKSEAAGQKWEACGTYTVDIDKPVMQKRVRVQKGGNSISANSLLSGTDFKPVDWVSTKTSVATVTSDGEITVVGKGSTKIYPVFLTGEGKRFKTRLSVTE